MTQLATTQPPSTSPTTNRSTRTREIGRIGPGPARRALSYLLLVVLTLLFVAPIAFMFIGSLKPSEKVLDGLGGFIPEDLSFDNYSGVFDRFNSEATGYFSWFFLTSMLVASVIVIAGLVINSMIAYALARLQWRGRNVSLTAVVLLVILPFEAIAVPLFYMLADYRNTYPCSSCRSSPTPSRSTSSTRSSSASRSRSRRRPGSTGPDRGRRSSSSPCRCPSRCSRPSPSCSSSPRGARSCGR